VSAEVWCRGYQPPRRVDARVCEWHRDEEDPKCEGCCNWDQKTAGSDERDRIPLNFPDMK
jgi:hypothetical protein